jgi:hypothetical protein
MRTGRTTARSALLLLLAGALAGTANAAVPERILFPVVGPVYHANDFGAPRGSGSHQGNDIVAPRWTPVVAVEAGRIERPSWSSSDCALILRGQSGTEYWYLHLNDVPRGGGRAGCVAGTAYAQDFKSGMRVRAGQVVGYVGNSGNARGGGTHLHFELHPNGGSAVSPYRWLRKAPRLLYAVSGRVDRVRLALFGSVLATPADGDAFALKVRDVAVSDGWRGEAVPRRVRLAFAPGVLVERKTAVGAIGPGALSRAVPGEKATVWTSWFTPTLGTQLARAGTLAAERIRLRGPLRAKRR